MPDARSRWASASPWTEALRGTVPVATGRLDADVLVVGAGLTGLTIATVLHRAGHSVLVVDRHGIGGITSRGSTGKLTALQGGLLADIAHHRGEEAAVSYARASARGVDGLRRMITELGIDCALEAATDHSFASTPAGLERARTVLDLALAADLPASWIDGGVLRVPAKGAVALPSQAHLDPGALCAGLAAALPTAAVCRGAVVEVDEHADRVTARTADGVELSAGHVVIATLGPVHDPALLTTRCEPRRSYAVAAPLDRPLDGTFISIDEPLRSIRPATIRGRPAVVVGGEGHTVGEPGGRSSRVRWDALERYAAEVLGAGGVTHRWVAHDLVPSDRVPFIGRASHRSDRRWVATGFQKWGISTAWVAADLIERELADDPRPHASLFDPRRLASSLTPALARDGLRAVRHLVGERVVDLMPGRRNRPRCTHLGCTLAFDPAESTWDCPCHGSRYEADGSVVSGPATAPLADPPAVQG